MWHSRGWGALMNGPRSLIVRSVVATAVLVAILPVVASADVQFATSPAIVASSATGARVSGRWLACSAQNPSPASLDVAIRDWNQSSFSFLPATGDQIQVDVDEGWATWISGTSMDVWRRDLFTGKDTRMTQDAAEQLWPIIDGTRILWQDERTGTLGVYVWDSATGEETRICDNTFYKSALDGIHDIDEDYVVHETSVGHPNLVYQDLLQPDLEAQFVDTVGAWQEYPAVHGDRIVWQDLRNTNWDIYMLQISTGEVTRLTTNVHNQRHPDIHGDLVVWQDDRNTNWDIYALDLRTGIEQRLTTNIADEVTPSVYGRRVAWDSNTIPGGSYLAIGPTEVERLAGDNRYATAVEVSQEHFAAAHVAVLATGEDFPDALAASALAGVYRAPLLLTKPTSLPGAVRAELKRLGVSEVVVTGGEAAVSSAVLSEIKAMGIDTERVAGANRYATAAKIAELVYDVLDENGVDPLKKVFIARGDGFADALAVSPMAYRMHIPVLLVKPGALPGDTLAALKALDIEDGYIAGGTAAVSAGVKGSIDAAIKANGGVATTRWAGDNRYGTAEQVVRAGLKLRWVDLDVLGIATGTEFPDALGGGAGCGSLGGALLLTKPNTVPGEVSSFLKEYKHDVAGVEIFGGTAAVAGGVDNQIEALLP